MGRDRETSRRHEDKDSDLEEEVIAWCDEENVDQKAREALLDAVPAVQREVMERGSLVDTPNPSRALMGRLKDAQSRGSRKADSEGPWQQTLEDFARDNDLDDRARDALLSARPEHQKAVLARGPLTDTRQPSAVLMSRLKQVQKSDPEPRMSREEIFLRENNIDPGACDKFWAAYPEVQQRVMEQGSLADTKNPSAALLGRIRHASKGSGESNYSGYEDTQAPRYDKSWDSWQQGSQQRQHQWESDAAPTVSEAEIHDFLVRNTIDFEAAQKFRAADVAQQRFVLDQGDLWEAKNTSAFLLSRLKKAASMRGHGKPNTARHGNSNDEYGGRGRSAHHRDSYRDNYGSNYQHAEDQVPKPSRSSRSDRRRGEDEPFLAEGEIVDSHTVDRFIEESGLDGKAAEAFHNAPREHVAWVMRKGTLFTARNPSAAGMARLREAEKALGAQTRGSFTPPRTTRSDQPTRRRGYSRGRSRSVRRRGEGSGGGGEKHASDGGSKNYARESDEEGLHEEAQAQVGAKSDDAFDAEELPIPEEAAEQVPEVEADDADGVWTGEEKPTAAEAEDEDDFFMPSANNQKEDEAGEDPEGGLDPNAIEAFIQDNGLDEGAANALFSAPPAHAAHVISQGPLKDMRNASAVAVARLRQIARGSRQGRSSRRERHHSSHLDPGRDGDESRRSNGYDDGRHGGDWKAGDAGGYVAGHDIELFIQENGIDDRAAAMVRRAPKEHLAAFIQRGSLLQMRNPSAAAVARLKEVAAEASASASSYDQSGHFAWGDDSRPPPRASRSRSRSRARGRSTGRSTGRDQGHSHGPGHGHGRDAAVTASIGKQYEEEANDFLDESGVDDKAVDAFWEATEEVQRAVMRQGLVSQARNPSAALMGRLKYAARDLEAGKGGGGGGGPGGGSGGGRGRSAGGGRSDWSQGPRGPSSRELEAFVQEIDLDGPAKAKFFGAPPEVQRAVIDRGSLKATRNPSSALVSRIRETERDLGWAHR